MMCPGQSRRTLKHHACREPELPGAVRRRKVTDGCRNEAKCRRGADVRTWIHEICVVQHVQTLSAELNRQPFFDSEIAEETGVQIQESRSAYVVSARIAEPLWLIRRNVHCRKGCRIEIGVALSNAPEDRSIALDKIGNLGTSCRIEVIPAALDDVNWSATQRA